MEDLDPAVAALLSDPKTYGPQSRSVERIDTHVAVVFLTETLAYKVKRPVSYSFLDFSTLAAREAACRAEVKLNRRTAPEIYRRVVPITRDTGGRLALDGSGEPVEWAVEMVRFEEGLRLDRLLAAGQLYPAQIDELVDDVLALHQSAEVRGAPFGGADGLADIVEENARDFAAWPGIFPADRARDLSARAREAVTANAALLDARRAAGRVRRCHGDLHLANVVVWRGRPTPFDCIEFSERIACIDVLYDLAFLVMDLDVRGRRDLANRAFSRYLGRSGEAAALAAFPLMLSLRAGVRAKVTAPAVTFQATTDAVERLAGEARRLFVAAEDDLRPERPRLLAIGGLSGTGKTTLARRLAPLLGRPPGALHLRSDVLRKRLAGVAPEATLPPAAYDRDSSARVYAGLLEEARAALGAGQAVVVDAVFARPEERDAVAVLAGEIGVDFHGLWLEAPPRALQARVDARRGDASDATAAVVRRQLDYDLGPIDWTRLETADGPLSVAARAAALLDLSQEIA